MMTRYKADDWEYPIIGLVLFRYISDTFSDYSVLHNRKAMWRRAGLWYGRDDIRMKGLN